MGCCRSRDKPSSNNPRERLEQGNMGRTFSMLVNMLNNQGGRYDESLDKKSRDLDIYVRELLKDPDWTKHIDNNDFGIWSIQGSKLSESIPVVLGYFRLNSVVKGEVITQALLDPESRSSWSTDFESIELIGQGKNDSKTLRLIRKCPFVNREYIVKASVFQNTYVTSLIMYSLDSEVKVRAKNARGEMLFTVYKVLDMPEYTVVVCIQQMQNKSGSGNEFRSLAASSLAQGLSLLKDSLEKPAN